MQKEIPDFGHGIPAFRPVDTFIQPRRFSTPLTFYVVDGVVEQRLRLNAPPVFFSNTVKFAGVQSTQFINDEMDLNASGLGHKSDTSVNKPGLGSSVWTCTAKVTFYLEDGVERPHRIVNVEPHWYDTIPGISYSNQYCERLAQVV